MEATCSVQGNWPRVSKRVSMTYVRITTYKPVVSDMSVLRLRYFSFAEQGRGDPTNMQATTVITLNMTDNVK